MKKGSAGTGPIPPVRAQETVPLGFGSVADRALSEYNGRLRFLKAVESVAPNVLVSLSALLPSYEEARGSVLLTREVYPPNPLTAMGWRLLATIGDEAEPKLPGFRRSLLKWAEHWHLDQDWFLDVALATLDYWHRLPAVRGTKWKYPPHLGAGEVLLGIEGNQVVDFFTHTSQEYLDKLKARIRAELEANRSTGPLASAQSYYEGAIIDRAMAEARSHLAEQMRTALPEGVAKTKEVPSRHYLWLVSHRVLGEPLATIARSEQLTDQGITESAVGKAVRSLQRSIGLTPVRTTRGRPRQRTK